MSRIQHCVCRNQIRDGVVNNNSTINQSFSPPLPPKHIYPKNDPTITNDISINRPRSCPTDDSNLLSPPVLPRKNTSKQAEISKIICSNIHDDQICHQSCFLDRRKSSDRKKSRSKSRSTSVQDKEITDSPTKNFSNTKNELDNTYLQKNQPDVIPPNSYSLLCDNVDTSKKSKKKPKFFNLRYFTNILSKSRKGQTSSSNSNSGNHTPNKSKTNDNSAPTRSKSLHNIPSPVRSSTKKDHQSIYDSSHDNTGNISNHILAVISPATSRNISSSLFQKSFMAKKNRFSPVHLRPEISGGGDHTGQMSRSYLSESSKPKNNKDSEASTSSRTCYQSYNHDKNNQMSTSPVYNFYQYPPFQPAAPLNSNNNNTNSTTSPLSNMPTVSSTRRAPPIPNRYHADSSNRKPPIWGPPIMCCTTPPPTHTFIQQPPILCSHHNHAYNHHQRCLLPHFDHPSNTNNTSTNSNNHQPPHIYSKTPPPSSNSPFYQQHQHHHFHCHHIHHHICHSPPLPPPNISFMCDACGSLTYEDTQMTTEHSSTNNTFFNPNAIVCCCYQNNHHHHHNHNMGNTNPANILAIDFTSNNNSLTNNFSPNSSCGRCSSELPSLSTYRQSQQLKSLPGSQLHNHHHHHHHHNPHPAHSHRPHNHQSISHHHSQIRPPNPPHTAVSPSRSPNIPAASSINNSPANNELVSGTVDTTNNESVQPSAQTSFSACTARNRGNSTTVSDVAIADSYNCNNNNNEASNTSYEGNAIAPSQSMSSTRPDPPLTATRNTESTINDSSGTNAITNNNNSSEEWRRMFHNNMMALRNLGWYWGPLKYQEAEQLVSSRRNGTFLVRDSGHDKHILSLTFRVLDTTYHTRIEYSQGNFSFWSQPESHSASTIVEFIDKAVAHSVSGKYHYFLQTSGAGTPPMEVSLLYPLSRFQVVQPLTHLSRFVILSHIREDRIKNLGLPALLKDYLSEKQIYIHSIDQFVDATKDTEPLTYLPSSLPSSTIQLSSSSSSSSAS